MMNTSSSCLINRFLALKSSDKCPEVLVEELRQLADDAITSLVATELTLDECLAPSEDFAFYGDEGIK